MERTNFEKLRVYRLSEKLADELWRTVTRWDYFNRDTVGKQLMRAGDSIGQILLKGPDGQIPGQPALCANGQRIAK
jgi:23S rRNA-intervening sequence protein